MRQSDPSVRQGTDITFWRGHKGVKEAAGKVLTSEAIVSERYHEL